MTDRVTNVVIAGLGGQGVIKASDILADAAFLAGLDVKKAEVHGMSQRGGSVTSDVRFGRQVFSPMVPPGEADYLLVLSDDPMAQAPGTLAPQGTRLGLDMIVVEELPHRRSVNVALLGVLSRHLSLEPALWEEAIRRNLAPKLHELNLQAFHAGRNNTAGKKQPTPR